MLMQACTWTMKATCTPTIQMCVRSAVVCLCCTDPLCHECYCHSTHQGSDCCRWLMFRSIDAADTRKEGAELEAKAEGEVELIAAISPAAVRLAA